MGTEKALFLDRDGIINVDHGYTFAIEGFEFMRGIFDLLHLFQERGHRLFIVTNQSGIGRGYYTEEDYRKLTAWMLERIKERGIAVDGVFHCPHTPEEHCHCRKPETGMIEQALQSHPVDLKRSWLIGDKQSDIQLAYNAGIGDSIFIGSDPSPLATLSFDSVETCAHYFQENPGKI